MELEESIIIHALCLNGADELEIRLQYRLLLWMLKNVKPDHWLDQDEFVLGVETVAGNRPVAVSYAKELLLRTNCFVFESGNWKFQQEFMVGGRQITQENLLDFFGEKKVSQACNLEMDAKKSAIVRGIQWCIHMVQLAKKDQMKGLPAFLRCGQEDSLIGKKAAGTATSDALSLLCSGGEYIKECGIDSAVLADSFDYLVRQVLECQCLEDNWDKGGFFPLEDQPEAAHPTVDATCLAVMALCDFYSNRNALEDGLELRFATENKEVEEAVFSGLDFLFRMQQPEGSYGIYKYAMEYPDGITLDAGCVTGIALPNENCTRMVISAMGVSKGSGIFDAREQYEFYGKCSKCIGSAYTYLKEHTAITQGSSLWAPYFGDKVGNYPMADVIVSAARVCRSLIPVWWQCEDERGQIQKYYLDFLAFWMQEEENIKGKIGKYSFKTPGDGKYSVGTYQWLSYPDMIAAFTVLQGYNKFDIPLRKEEWEFLERVVDNVLEMQHTHGHWNLPSDAKKPFCAASLAAIELLKEYRMAKGLI